MRMERKYIVRRRVAIALAVLLFLLVWAWLNSITTPAECKVPVEQMSQFCKDLLYP